MNIASQTSYNFTEERQRKESPADFVSHFMDVGHTEFVMKCAERLNMSVEDATAYALAMFNGLQDLFYFHFNLNLGEIDVTAIRKNGSMGEITTLKDEKRIMKFREALKEPYFTNRGKNYLAVTKYLKAQSENKDRLLGGGIKLADPVKYEAKRAKKRSKAKKLGSKKYAEKQKRIKKKAAKRWEWTLCI